MGELDVDAKLNPQEPEGFDWIQLHNELNATVHEKPTFKEKLIEKTKSNPFIPIGK